MFWSILLVVVVVIVWFGVFMALAIAAIDGESILAGVAAFVVLVLGCTTGFYFIEKDENAKREACEADGGEYVKVGQHAVSTGKTVVIVDDYECGQRVPG